MRLLFASFVGLALMYLAYLGSAFAADSLKVNPRLNYSSDSNDGPLLAGASLQQGTRSGLANYVFLYSRTCYNSKRQARRTAELYTRYKGRVHFVTIDLDAPRSREQQVLVKKHYQGFVPHVVVFSATGELLYERSGEVENGEIARILDKDVAR